VDHAGHDDKEGSVSDVMAREEGGAFGSAMATWTALELGTKVIVANVVLILSDFLDHRGVLKETVGAHRLGSL